MPKQSAQGTWIALLLLIIYAFIILTPGEALSDNGLPSHLWQHVLDVEVNRHVQQLGEVSETEGALTRTYFSDAHKKAAQKVRHCITALEGSGMHAEDVLEFV